MKCVLVSDWLRRITTKLRSKGACDGDDENIVLLAKKLTPHGDFLFNTGLEKSFDCEFKAAVITNIREELTGVIKTNLVKHYQPIFTQLYDDDGA